jgi:ABC-type uncharacterized transport system substrate-binding protein
MSSLLRLRAGTVALALAGLPAGVTAHPHVFIESGVDFLFDAEGRVTHLRITWLYDHLWSLILIDDLGLEEDADGTLSQEARDAIAFDQSQWIDGYDGDASLLHDGIPVELSGPIEPQADYRGGQVEIRFLRALSPPVVPGPSTVAKIYDPTYFIAYTIDLEPVLEHAPPGCRADVVPFEPTSSLAALQRSLFDLPPDEDPDEPVGQLFADRVVLTCD